MSKTKKATADPTEGLGPAVFPPNVDPQDYPPYKMSPAEEAATVGRYRDDQVAAQAPVIDTGGATEYATGRTVAAPQGTVYVRDEAAKPGKEVPVADAAVAAQSEAVRSATPDMTEPEEGDHLSDTEKGAKSGPFEDRKAPEVGYGALPEGTVSKLDAKEEEMVLARQGTKTPEDQVLAEPAKPATEESVAKAFEVTEASKAQASDEAVDVQDVAGKLTRDPEEQAAANEAAEPDEGPTLLDKQIAEASGSDEEVEYVEPSELNVAELKAELDSRGIQYDSKAHKADLVKLLEAAD